MEEGTKKKSIFHNLRNWVDNFMRSEENNVKPPIPSVVPLQPPVGLTPVGNEDDITNDADGQETDMLGDQHRKVLAALLDKQAKLLTSYDQLAQQLGGDSQMLLNDVVQKMIDTMILAGCTPISDEKTYDMGRHRPQPFRLAAPGTPIRSTIRSGVEWQGHVYIPALVELDTDNL